MRTTLEVAMYLLIFILVAPIFMLGTNELYKYDAYNTSYVAHIPQLNETQAEDLEVYIDIATSVRARTTRPVLIFNNEFYTNLFNACGISYPTIFGCVVVLSTATTCKSQNAILLHELLHCYYWQHSSQYDHVMNPYQILYYDKESIMEEVKLDYEVTKQYIGKRQPWTSN